MSARYILTSKDPRNGNTKKFDCPYCHAKMRFRRFFDLVKREWVMDEDWGVCDRVNECGMDKRPPKGLWFEYESRNRTAGVFAELKAKQSKQRFVPPWPHLQTVQVYTDIMKEQEAWPCPLSGWLAQLGIPAPAINAALKGLHVTGWDGKPGLVCWWQTNGEGNAMTGRIIHYDTSTGHRKKGETDRPFWVHNTQPEWNRSQPPKYLFGLDMVKAGACCLVVESEKSALLCHIYNILHPGNDLIGQYDAFLATGGATMLETTLRNSAPILYGRKAKIELCPDDDEAGRKSIKAASSHPNIKVNDLAAKTALSIDTGWDIGDTVEMLLKKDLKNG